MPKITKGKAEEGAVKRPSRDVRHDPIARPTLERQIGGEEMKQAQPRKNVKKPVKKRIYKKMRQADKDEAADPDAMEDLADDKVVREAQLQNVELRKEQAEQKKRDKKDGMDNGEEEAEPAEGEEGYLSYDSDDNQSTYSATSQVDNYEEYVREEQQITEEEEAAFNLFLQPKADKKVRTIADIIEQKMQDRQQGGGGAREGGDDEMMEEEGGEGFQQVDPRVEQVYEGVATLLSRYKSGKLPKALKLVPSLTNWEQIIWITRPDTWSNHAYYACTRIFASCLRDPMAQRFYNLVLLPRVLEDLKYNKRLNYHLYAALKKALYKPAAFYKGVVLPVVDSGACTLRTAIVLSSVLKKVSVPVLHSSAALLKMSMNKLYTGSESVFIKTLLDKKYALPYRVIDAVVDHFGRFRQDHRELPVKWHLALLTLAQRYKNDLSSQQKEVLKEVMRKHSHYQITPEVRRELFSVQAGGPAPPRVGGSRLANTTQKLDGMLGY